MLDVVEVEHHVVAHLERQVDLLDLLGRRRVRRLGRVDRHHVVPERRPVDLHEHQAEPVGDVLHQRRLAVAGRRDQQQHAHPVGALLVARRAELLRHVGADQRQVHLADQLVAYERGQHLRHEFVDTQALLLALDHLLAQPPELAEARHPHAHELAEALEELVEPQLEHPVADARVLAQQPGHRGALERALDLAVELALGQRQHGRLDHRRAHLRLLRRRRHERLEPCAQQLEALAQAALERAQVVVEGAAAAAGLERGEQGLLQGDGRGAGDEAGLLGGELLDEVGAGALDIAGREHQAVERDELGDAARQLVRERGGGGREAERRAQAGDALGPAVPRGAQLGAIEVGPEQAGERARGRRHAQQPGGRPQREQLLEDRRRVGVVQAALIALVVAVRGVAADQLEQPAGLALGRVQASQVEALLAGLGRGQHRGGEVLAAVDLLGL